MLAFVLACVLAVPVLSLAAEPDPRPVPTDSTIFADHDYRFRLVRPPRFTVRRRTSTELHDFSPAPAAAVFFMNPNMASGDLAGIEPPDLEVRVYRAQGRGSLKSWLAQNDVAYGDTGVRVSAYREGSVNGLEVCQSTLIAPGCSVYVRDGDRVYQLRAATRDGERMLATFLPLPRSLDFR